MKGQKTKSSDLESDGKSREVQNGVGGVGEHGTCECLLGRGVRGRGRRTKDLPKEETHSHWVDR